MLHQTDYSHLGVLGLVVALLALSVWAAVVTIRDDRLPVGTKVVWVVVIFVFPIIGLAIWAAVRALLRRKRT